MREFTKTTQRPSSETPLSVTHRPEALRHRLAPGMPLNEREYIMRCAIEHAVVVHRQAQRCRTQKCDSVPTNRECESGAEAMCRRRFGVYKKGFFSFEDCRSKSLSTAGRRGWKKHAMSSIRLRSPTAEKPRPNSSAGYVCNRRHPVIGEGRVRPQLTNSRADVWHLCYVMSGELDASRIRGRI